MKTTLAAYRKKRHFQKTKEPKGGKKRPPKKPIFVIQKHEASHLHFDFRIQIGNVLTSWALPKGPSALPSIKRLAMLTEDHPIEYADFEGVIPEDEYGGGTVMIWDFGTFENIKQDSLKTCFEKGRIEIDLSGNKIKGRYALIRFKDEKNWLLIKMRDSHVRKKDFSFGAREKSAKTGRTMAQIYKELIITHKSHFRGKRGKARSKCQRSE